MKWEYVFPIISTTLWGVSITGAKIVSAAGFSPVEITFFRFFLASIIFLPLLVVLNRSKTDIIPQSRQAWLAILGLSLTGVAVNNSIFYLGLERTDASVASIIVSLNPLMAMIFAVLMLGEKFTSKKLISVILGVIGVSFIIGFTDSTGQLAGNLYILLGITIWGSSFSFSRKATDTGLGAIAVTGWSEILGTLFLMPSVLFNHSLKKMNQIRGEVLFWVIFMGVLSSVVAYILHYHAISRLGASTVAPSTNIIPISGTITAYLLLGDKIGGYPLIGAILVLSGVLLVQWENYKFNQLKDNQQEIYAEAKEPEVSK